MDTVSALLRAFPPRVSGSEEASEILNLFRDARVMGRRPRGEYVGFRLMRRLAAMGAITGM